MNEFKRFEDRLTGLIESLSPSGRRRLSAELAKRLRQSQQRRVMAQKAPDGTPYAPRQQQSARKKTGRVKRKMFAKLITSRFLHTCPANLLPWLAWSFSVDRWDDKWPEATKRAVIRDAYFIHCHKGTIGAIRRVVEPLGYGHQYHRHRVCHRPCAGSAR
ncbi:phage tail protein I [Escherichia coli]|nr:phage tail protein I [Escherichia coli]